MADISGLTLRAPERIEGPYQDAGEYTPPPPEGQYYVQAPDSFEFTADKNGMLQVKSLKLTVVGDANGGQVGLGHRTFAYISNAKSKFRNGNTALDYLRACGIEELPPASDDAKVVGQWYADRIEMTAGRTFPVSLQWSAYDEDSEEDIKGADKFPKSEDEDAIAGRSYRYKSKVTPGKELLARTKVKRFISTVQQPVGA